MSHETPREQYIQRARASTTKIGDRIERADVGAADALKRYCAVCYHELDACSHCGPASQPAVPMGLEDAENVLRELADKENWITACGEVTGWSGSNEPWKMAQKALAALRTRG